MRREASVSRLAAALLAALGIAPLASQAATIIVTTTGDAVADPGCTLRNAIVTMNNGSTSGAGEGNCRTAASGTFGTNDTINFDTAVAAFPNGGANTILLGNGQLSISDAYLTINATANGNVTIDAQQNSRVMYDNAANGSSLTLNHLTLRNGTATTKCAGFYQGGGICATYANLALNDSTLSGNSTGTFGGFGGAVLAKLGSATLTRCTLSGNSAIRGGGAIETDTTVALIDSTLSGNTAQKGGAIYATNGGVTLTNSTLYGNSATNGSGGALYIAVVFNPVTIAQTTVAGNTASASGGGLYIQSGFGSPIVSNNSLFSANSAGTSGGNIAGPSGGIAINGAGNLVFGANTVVNASFGSVPINGDPMLGVLTDNGGPTQTMALKTASAALHIAASCASTDQRGYSRPVNHCDAGAFEDTVFFNGFEGY